MEGWIKVHRNLLEWRWMNSPKHVSIFMTLLLRANHKETHWRREVIKPGQLLTGVNQLTQWSGVPLQSVRTVLKDLETTGEINKQVTTKYSIITLLNWEKYQLDNKQLTNNQQTTNKQLTTSKNVNNGNNEENDNNIINAKKIFPDATPQEILRKPSPLSFLFDQSPEIQNWLNAGIHETHFNILKGNSHHEIVDLIERAFQWAMKDGKNLQAAQWLHTFSIHKPAQAYGAKKSQKTNSRVTPGNPMGNPYLDDFGNPREEQA